MGEGSGKRKLLNLKNTVGRAAAARHQGSHRSCSSNHKILNEREVHARYEIFLENYNKTINVEGQLMVLMANRYILPAALEYQRNIGAERGGGEGRRRQVGAGQEAARHYTKLVDKLKTQTDALAKLLEHSGGSAEKHAKPCATRSSRRWTSCAKRATRSKS